jgi:hypothetical protein
MTCQPPSLNVPVVSCVPDKRVDGKALTVKFDSKYTSNVNLSDDYLSATSLGSGWARSSSGISKGSQRWWMLLEKDKLGDEGEGCAWFISTSSSPPPRPPSP